MKRIVWIIMIFILGLCYSSLAQGDLLITPSRVVFEGSKQKEEVNLVNTGKDTATYSISFVQYNMKEDGSFVLIEKPDSGQMFAEPFLRIFPRQVTLAPGEPQVIIVQFRRKPDMADGEYRSHLYFRSEKITCLWGLKIKERIPPWSRYN
jgi:P pilus assembly chaperone PapD